MEQDSFEKEVKKIATSLILISFTMFTMFMFIWPKTPDLIAYILIFIFIAGIILLLFKKQLRKIYAKINGHKKILIISSLVLLSIFFIYWFGVRPGYIRKNCEWQIFSNERAIYTGTTAIRQNNKYRQCLIKNGLPPESMFVNTDQ